MYNGLNGAPTTTQKTYSHFLIPILANIALFGIKVDVIKRLEEPTKNSRFLFHTVALTQEDDSLTRDSISQSPPSLSTVMAM